MDFKRTQFLGILKILQVIFYLLFVLLWFKGNFSVLKKIPVPYHIPLFLLMIVILIRLYFGARLKKKKLQKKNRKNMVALAIIIFLATIVRIPFLVDNYGLMDSDKAISALMGKHISEGKQPALYYYGQLRQGSLIQHYHALLFKIFGYSILVLKISAYSVFIAFICAHFFLLKEIFSFGFAILIGLFYCLPIQNLIISSFDDGSGYPLVFLFGSLIFYLTYQICYTNKVERIPMLGFLMGLAFWTHQISFIFLFSSSIFLVFKFRLQLTKYLKILLYFLIGFFPVLLSEVYHDFVLVRYLIGDESVAVNWQKISQAKTLMISLFSADSPRLDYFYLFVIFAGLAVIVFQSIKKKKPLASLIFAVYFVLFMTTYLLSDFSDISVIRYLFILYLVVPVLLASVFLLIKTKIKYLAMTLFFLFIFFLGNRKSIISYRTFVKEEHSQIKRVVTAMQETGEKHWMGEYWTSYLINAVTKEDMIVASYTVERYYPYYLSYYNKGRNNNWIFSMKILNQKRPALRFINTLEKLKINHRKKEVGNYLLIYDIEGNVFSKTIHAPLPKIFPRIVLDSIDYSSGNLQIHFINKDFDCPDSFRLHIDISDYSSKIAPVPMKEKFSVAIPFPDEHMFPIKYYLDYKGLFIGQTLQETVYSLPKTNLSRSRQKSIDYLLGFGPRKEVFNKKMIVCDREAVLRINKPLHKSTKISLDLYSPFLFSGHPFWYRDYCQEVEIYVNGHYLEKRKMPDGKNIITIDCSLFAIQTKENIITLRFTYAMGLSAQDLFTTAAFLDKVMIASK